MRILLSLCALTLCTHAMAAQDELCDVQLEAITAGAASATASANALGTHTSTSTTTVAEVRVGGGIEKKPGAARALLEQVSVESKASAAVSVPVVKPPSGSDHRTSAAAALITQFRNSR